MRSPEHAGTLTPPRSRQIYELRRYRLRIGRQRDAARAYFRDALVPTLTRLQCAPVGVLDAFVGEGPTTIVVIPHPTAESVLTLGPRLLGDEDYCRAGAPFLTAPADRPVFERVESSMLRAFESFPTLVTPDITRPRLFELRRYEGPTDAASLTKIEMFDHGGELEVFRKVGFRPVFFGQTIVGTRMPNLEYLLVFDDLADRDAVWQRFRGDADWKALSQRPGYQDAAIMSSTTMLLLTPQECSQI